MSLKDEIKQTRPFPHEASEAVLSIVRTAAMLEHAANDALKPYGLTTTQYNALRILKGAGRGGLCGRDVGERLVAWVPDVPRLLDRLESMELITRERDPEDRRHVTARITRKGLDLVEKATPKLHALEEARLAHLPRATLRQLIDGLQAVRDG